MKHLLTAIVCCLAVAGSAQTAYNPDVDGDNNIGITDLLALLSLFSENDLDDDGIWDSQDDCVGEYDECGVCNGEGPTVEVIESITILYDSVYAEQIDEWWVFEVGADTVFNYFCLNQLNDSNIYEAVDLWLSDQEEAEIIYGHISSWDVSDVTYMAHLFQNSSFNDDISSWDVSSVTNMSSMFDGAGSFNQDISAWDVSSVTNMYQMFRIAGSFNSDISSWDVSSVVNMRLMFWGSGSFNSDISSWDVSNVTTMYRMFGYAGNFDQDISAWDVSSVGDMTLMFELTPLSDENKCLIHTSFSPNPNWPYEWIEFCPNGGFASCGDNVGFNGHSYTTVQIGDQCWFAENLRAELYTNGDAIAANLSDGEWSSTTSGAVAVFGEDAGCEEFSPDGDACDPDWSLNEYGRLYNWYAVDDERGLCPTGWHVPTDGEWNAMTDFLGGSSVAGAEIKSTYGWHDEGNGTNSSGFSGLPGGNRSPNGNFYSAGYRSDWWSSSPSGSSAFSRYVYGDSPSVSDANFDLHYGFSVRCIKNAE